MEHIVARGTPLVGNREIINLLRQWKTSGTITKDEYNGFQDDCLILQNTFQGAPIFQTAYFLHNSVLLADDTLDSIDGV